MDGIEKYPRRAEDVTNRSETKENGWIAAVVEGGWGMGGGGSRQIVCMCCLGRKRARAGKGEIWLPWVNLREKARPG